MQDTIPQFKPIMSSLDKAYLAQQTDVILYLRQADTNLDTYLKNKDFEVKTSKNSYPSGILPVRIFDIFNRIIEKTSYIHSLYTLGKILHKLLENKMFNMGKRPNAQLINIANIYFHLESHLKGTNLNRKLISSIQQAIFHLNKRQLNKHQTSQLKKLQKSVVIPRSQNYINFPKNLQKIENFKSQATDNQKAQVILDIMDIMSEFNSFQQQYEVFKNYFPRIFKILLQNSNSKSFRLYKEIINLIKLFFPENEMLVQHQQTIGVASIPSLYVLQKELVDIVKESWPASFQAIFQVLTHILDNCELVPDLFSVLIDLVKSVFFMFEGYRNKLGIILLKLFEKIGQYKDDQQMRSIVIKAMKFKAALEWQNVIPQDLKIGILMSQKAKIFKSAIKSLKDSELFYSKSLYSILQKLILESLQVIQINNISSRFAFPKAVTVAAGQCHIQIIQVKNPFSILSCGYATLTDDIAFGIDQILEDSVIDARGELSNLKSVIPIQRAPQKKGCIPQKISLMLKQPGLYRLCWSNQYSWMAAKRLRYRISLLEYKIAQKKSQKAQQVSQDQTQMQMLEIRKELQRVIQENSQKSHQISLFQQCDRLIIIWQNQVNQYTIHIGKHSLIFNSKDTINQTICLEIQNQEQFFIQFLQKIADYKSTCIVIGSLFFNAKMDNRISLDVRQLAHRLTQKYHSMIQGQEEEIKIPTLEMSKIDLLNFLCLDSENKRLLQNQSSWLSINCYDEAKIERYLNEDYEDKKQEKEAQQVEQKLKVQTSFIRTRQMSLIYQENGINNLPFGSFQEDQSKLFKQHTQQIIIDFMFLQKTGFNQQALSTIIYNISLIQPQNDLIISMTQDTPVNLSNQLQQGINTLFKMNIEGPAYLPHLSIMGRRSLKSENDRRSSIYQVSKLIDLMKQE